MRDEHLLGQLIVMGLPGPRLTDGLRNLVRKIQPGGYIMFTRNLASPEQVHSLITELQSLSKEPVMFTVDQEGGRVSRLKVIGEEPPSASELRKYGGLEVCQQHGKLMGQVQAALGFNLDLAPVVDYCLSEEADNSLRGRCFGTNPDETIEKADAFLKGMQAEGVHGTAKHFPGYTFCELDPHGDLPLITRSKEELENNELRVFKYFADKADAFMIGHGHFTAYHQESIPASLSPVLIQDVLRGQLGFKGVVMTDDLEMGAVANRYGSEEATRLAMKAGEDLLLLCHNPACVEIAFDTLKAMPDADVSRAVEAVSNYRKTLRRPPEKFDSDRFQEINAAIRAFRVLIRGA